MPLKIIFIDDDYSWDEAVRALEQRGHEAKRIEIDAVADMLKCAQPDFRPLQADLYVVDIHNLRGRHLRYDGVDVARRLRSVFPGALFVAASSDLNSNGQAKGNQALFDEIFQWDVFNAAYPRLAPLLDLPPHVDSESNKQWNCTAVDGMRFGDVIRPDELMLRRLKRPLELLAPLADFEADHLPVRDVVHVLTKGTKPPGHVKKVLEGFRDVLRTVEPGKRTTVGSAFAFARRGKGKELEKQALVPIAMGLWQFGPNGRTPRSDIVFPETTSPIAGWRAVRVRLKKRLVSYPAETRFGSAKRQDGLFCNVTLSGLSVVRSLWHVHRLRTWTGDHQPDERACYRFGSSCATLSFESWFPDLVLHLPPKNSDPARKSVITVAYDNAGDVYAQDNEA